MAQARTGGGYSFRTLLLIYAGLLAIPLLILLGVFFLRASALERGQTEQHLVQMARGLANDLDRDFERRLTILRALSNSPAIEARDWQGFYEQARAALRDDAYIIVIDREMRQILNTYVPLGEQPEFTADQETARRVFATGRADVSDLFDSLVTKGPVYNVDLPIIENGEVRFVIILGLKTESLASLLQGQDLPEGWVCTAWDGKGRVLATTLGPQFIGAAMPPAEGRRDAGLASVHHSRRIDDAAPVWRAVAASRLSGWRISVAAPIAAVEAPLRRSALLWGGSIMFALALAMGLAARFAGNLTQPMRRLSEAARSVGVGAPPAPPAPGIFAEVNKVGAILHDSDAKLRERERQLAEQLTERKRLEQRRDFLAAELAHRGKNLLAIVQSISVQTLRPSREREAFLGRLESLSRTYAALDLDGFEGASIATIVANEIGAFSDRAEIRGPDFMLNKKATQAVALILHELATNAVKHGAWSGERGKVFVNWSIETDGAGQQFFFRWRERDGPPVTHPAERGFGAIVLLKAPALQFGKEPEEKFAPEGYSYVFSAPASRVRRSGEPAREDAMPASAAPAKRKSRSAMTG